MQINKLSQQTASDISLSQVKKCYGKWQDILFPQVKSTESADRSNIVKLTFDNGNQDTEAKNELEGNKMQQQTEKINVSNKKERNQ